MLAFPKNLVLLPVFMGFRAFFPVVISFTVLDVVIFDLCIFRHLPGWLNFILLQEFVVSVFPFKQ